MSETSAYHHGDLKRALIDTALELLREDPEKAISLRALARRAGVSPGAPYYHFKDKLGVLAAVAEEGWQVLNEALEGVEAQGDDVQEQLLEMGRVYLRFGLGHPAHYGVMFDKQYQDEARFESLHERSERSLIGLIASLSGLRGEPPESPELMGIAISIWALLHGFLTLWNQGVLQHKPYMPQIDALIDAIAASALAVAQRQS